MACLDPSAECGGGVAGTGTLSSDIATPGNPDDSAWATVTDDIIKIGGTLGALVLGSQLKQGAPPTTRSTMFGAGVAAQQPPQKTTISLGTLGVIGLALLAGGLFFKFVIR